MATYKKTRGYKTSRRRFGWREVTDKVIARHRLPCQWSPEVERELARLADAPAEEEKRGRTDLRDVCLLTIDGADARDFDDAVYCEKGADGDWRLLVAIADVSSYVKPDSALDAQARLRGTSVYFPRRVSPMLPEALSNGLCSIRPAEDRLCLVCEMRIGADGEVASFVFFEAVMRSRARLTYDAVAGFLEKNAPLAEAVAARDRAAVGENLKNLRALHQTLLAARERRQAIDFDMQEFALRFDAGGKISGVSPCPRNEAHRLIEECMLCANVSAAKFLERHKIPALYRVHDGPNEEGLENFRTIIRTLGATLPHSVSPEPGHFQTLLRETSGTSSGKLVRLALLRIMGRAVYTEGNRGHFGLNYPMYTHFTSPIRRYPDLLVHRAIRSVIHGGKKTADVRRTAGARVSEKLFPYRAKSMVKIGEHCSATERRADEASMEVNELLICSLLGGRVGDEFNGVINGCTAFGVFVELVDYGIDGLVHLDAFTDDHYVLKEKTHQLVGRKTGKRYCLGDSIRVVLAGVNAERARIRLRPCGMPAPPRNHRRRAGRRGA